MLGTERNGTDYFLERSGTLSVATVVFRGVERNGTIVFERLCWGTELNGTEGSEGQPWEFPLEMTCVNGKLLTGTGALK